MGGHVFFLDSKIKNKNGALELAAGQPCLLQRKLGPQQLSDNLSTSIEAANAQSVIQS